jgi:hypothetical protein
MLPLGDREIWIRFPESAKYFYLFTVSRRLLNGHRGLFSPAENWSWHESCRSSPSAAKAKIAWRYACSHPHAFKLWPINKHTGNFTMPYSKWELHTFWRSHTLFFKLDTILWATTSPIHILLISSFYHSNLHRLNKWRSGGWLFRRPNSPWAVAPRGRKEGRYYTHCWGKTLSTFIIFFILLIV